MKSESTEEVRILEAALLGQASVPLRPPAACGRLAQLYLEAPIEPAQASRALTLATVGLRLVNADDPLYPKLLHFVAMALRLVDTPPLGALGPDGKAIEFERKAYQLSLDPAPQQALDFARHWGEWAWLKELWAEAAEAYDLAERALGRIVLHMTKGLLPHLEFLHLHSHVALRGAYAYARLERVREAVILLENAASLFAGDNRPWRVMPRLASVGRADLGDQLLAALIVDP